MTPPPYQDMAKEFLDLWQKQMTSVMGDKQFIHAMLEFFQNLQAKPNAQPNTSTPHAADAPAAEHGLLAELTFRLAMCEKRIAALEAGRSTAKKPAPSTKRRAAKPHSARGAKTHK